MEKPLISTARAAAILLCLMVLLVGSPTKAEPEQPPAVNPSYSVQKVAGNVFAAIMKPGGSSTSNALFVLCDSYVIVASAHLTADAVRDLEALITGTTGLPIRYYILTHHHRGYTHIDFDFPENAEVIMTWQTWQGISGEKRQPEFQVLFFQEGLTLKLPDQTLILSNLNRGHTEGDLLVYLPESKVLFAGDLFYNGPVGYLGDGFMENWVLNLEMMLSLEAKTIIPGQGEVAGPKELAAYLTFLRAFLTEVLRHIEKGDSLKETLKSFSLPGYGNLEGFQQFQTINIQRAYEQMKGVASERGAPQS